MKKIVAVFLAGIMLLGMVSMAQADAGMENFQPSQTYTAGQFTDVKDSDWFAAGVKSAYELGLMNGSGGVFKPSGNLTVAEALAIACRLHSIYADNGQQFTQGSPWYQVYVDYAVANKIMMAGQLDPTKQITREQFAYLMCGAIPSADLNAINNVATVPDVKSNSTYGGFVYRLYNAGVVTGSDKYGTFKPTTNIQRSEVATIVTRMADKSQRKTFTLTKVVKAKAQSSDVCIYEDSNVKISFLGIDKISGITAMQMSLRLENKSDKNTLILLQNGYVNDTSVTFLGGNPDLDGTAPHKKAVCIFVFGYNQLGFSTVDELRTIEFSINVVDANKWLSSDDDRYTTETIEINLT